MAIATDIEVTWNGTIDATNKIGLSKPFTELPSDVWADDSAFITAYNNPAAKFTKISDGYPTCPVKSNDCPWYLTGGIGYSNINHNSNSIYLRSAIICVPDDFVYNTWNGNQGGRIRDNINNFRIVTSMSTVKNGVDVSLTVQDGTVVGAQYVLKETLTGSSSNGGITIGAGTYILMVVDIYTVDGNYYLNIPYSLPGFVYDTDNGDGVMGMWAYDSSVNKMFSLSPQIFTTDDGRISITGGATYNVNTWNRHELPAVEGDENLIFCASYIPWNWYLSLSGNVHYHLLAVSRFGLKFKYNSDTYKPIIAQGVVTGYTTDMSVPSDIDNWTDISGHNISPTPPVPPSPLVSDEQVTGGTYYGGGFLKIYACTKAELDHLQAWMSGGPAGTGGTNPTTIQPNMAPMQQMVGLTGFPIIVEPESQLYSTTFTFTDADNAAVNTGWTTQKAQLSAEEFYTGVLTVKSWEKDDNDVPWMDYSATVECYVPFCGVVGLDPQVVMGHNLKVRMWVDYVTGDCSSYIECDSDGLWHPVAYMTGHVGASEAMSAAAYGQLMGAREANAHAMTQAVIGGVKNLVTGTINTATANYARGAGNYSVPVPSGQSSFLANQISHAGGIMTSGYSAMAAITGAVDLGVGLTQQSLDNRYNYEVAKNSLGTTIMGSFGSSSAWHFPLTPYIKVTYPTPMSKDVTNYGKTYGVPVHKTGTLDDYHGYTICNNVDTSGISTATSEEQALIKQFLESGVYLP